MNLPARNGAVRTAALGLMALALLGMRPAPDLVPVANDDVDVAAVVAEIERALASQNPVTLDWKTMAALNYRTGEMPER
jgi:hypothetical protein